MRSARTRPTTPRPPASSPRASSGPSRRCGATSGRRRSTWSGWIRTSPTEQGSSGGSWTTRRAGRSPTATSPSPPCLRACTPPCGAWGRCSGGSPPSRPWSRTATQSSSWSCRGSCGSSSSRAPPSMPPSWAPSSPTVSALGRGPWSRTRRWRPSCGNSAISPTPSQPVVPPTFPRSTGSWRRTGAEASRAMCRATRAASSPTSPAPSRLGV
mmetsp:Transcript_53833/g.145020  ORF Transcript_53833/g.145020 Transcript_53833/m.145020 type:complete len:212 (-) Transcript_53833:232-867(-)